jgi:hypothetical protein
MLESASSPSVLCGERSKWCLQAYSILDGHVAQRLALPGGVWLGGRAPHTMAATAHSVHRLRQQEALQQVCREMKC